jgi:hypothetical protein
MKKAVGVWIDHRKAVIVVVTDEGEEVRLTISRVERQVRRPGDAPLQNRAESRLVLADDIRERKATQKDNIYLDAVIACMGDADPILLFGPGEVKGELRERIEKSRLHGRVVAVETAERMTDRQVAAEVRKHFAES